MPRYYFDTADGDRDCDDIGIELRSDDEAVSEAIRYAGALIGDQPVLVEEASELVVTVRSDDGIVARVTIQVDRLR